MAACGANAHCGSGDCVCEEAFKVAASSALTVTDGGDCADCAEYRYKDGADCLPQKELRDPCAAGTECLTGFCVVASGAASGYCCASDGCYGHGSCATGQCACDSGYKGSQCGECAEGFYEQGEACFAEKTKGASCGADGHCQDGLSCVDLTCCAQPSCGGTERGSCSTGECRCATGYAAAACGSCDYDGGYGLTASGACAARRAGGATCRMASECTNGNCEFASALETEGVCCAASSCSGHGSCASGVCECESG